MCDEPALRRIVHVDMDAFFAAVEQRDRPELRGRPVVIGGDPAGRGVVATASYEARRFGIHSAMPCSRAARLCPDAVFVRPDIGRYKAVSRQIQAVFLEVTELVEPLSLDEAYLDVTTNELGLALGRDVARWIRAQIRERTGLTASAGVGPNKLVAKIASDLRKPDGQYVVPPERVLDFLAGLPVRKLWSVGPATAAQLAELGVSTVGELRALDPGLLQARLGRRGRFLQGLAHGADSREVAPRGAPKIRGAERTFARDVTDLGELVEHVEAHAARVAAGLERMDRLAATVTLKLRYSDFTTISRSRTLDRPTRAAERIAAVAVQLLSATEAGRRPVRLVGVSTSGFTDELPAEQLSLPLRP